MKIKTHNNVIKCSFVLLVLVIMFLSPVPPCAVYAADTTQYSNVLTDLQKDTNFRAEDYPEMDNNYTLQVIQIAESTAGELLIYVYQPSGSKANLLATSLNMSNYGDNNLTFTNYKLILINSSGVFYKYKVQEFTVSTDRVRYYEISSIFRPFNSVIDTPLENNNEVTEVSFPVGKFYTISGDSTNMQITCIDVELITITSKYVGFVRYEDGNWWSLWGESACDRHFIAFSTDKKIDKLIEADVYYRKQSATYNVDMLSIPFHKYWTYGSISDDQYAHLTYSQKGEYDNNHFVYSWDRIQSISDFKNSVNVLNTYSCGIFDVDVVSKITDEGMRDLEGQQWVLSFLDTAYQVTRTMSYETYNSTRVSDVSILRLEFETDGIVYNLGVVDNKQTGDDEPINETEENVRLKDIVKLILLLVAIIFVFVVFAPILPIIFKFLIAVIKYIFLGLWWLISLPFKIFKKD